MLLRSQSRKCCTFMHPHRHITHPHTCHSQNCYRVHYTVMHYNALHYILRFTVLLCIVRYWYATQWITIHCNAMASSTMHCTTLCRGSLYYSALWYTVVYYDAMNCAGLQWVALHYSTLYYFTQQCTFLIDKRTEESFTAIAHLDLGEVRPNTCRMYSNSCLFWIWWSNVINQIKIIHGIIHQQPSGCGHHINQTPFWSGGSPLSNQPHKQGNALRIL